MRQKKQISVFTNTTTFAGIPAKCFAFPVTKNGKPLSVTENRMLQNCIYNFIIAAVTYQK